MAFKKNDNMCLEDTLWCLRRMTNTCEIRLTIWNVGKH